MTSLTNWMLAFAAQGIPLGMAILLLLAMTRHLRRRYGARWLCRLWLILTALLLLPLRLVLPGVPAARVTIPAAWSHVQTAVMESEMPDTLTAVSGNVAATVQQIAGTSPADAGSGHIILSQLSLLEILAVLWLTGVATVLAWQTIAWFAWRRRAVNGAASAGADWQEAGRQAMQAVQLRRMPPLLASNAVRGPLTAGVLRPVLLVPGKVPAPADAALMLTHELTHLRRHDLAFKLLLTVVCGLHWYNPAVWLLARRAGRDIETACDEQVVAGQGSAFRAAYSDALLHAARMGRAPALTTGFALSRKDWADRLRQLWDLTPKRRGRMPLACLALAAVLAGGLVACGTAEPSDSPGQPNPVATTTKPDPTPPATAETAAVDFSGEQPVWPGLIGWPTSLSADPPVALADLSYGQVEDYSVPDIGRTGYAAVEQGGVALYTTTDGGASWQQQHADLTGILGGEPFLITNYQMVSDSTGFLVLRMGTDEETIRESGSLVYWTDDDFVVLRTVDGGDSWELTGRHSLPEGTAQGRWHLQPFLWLNERVGFFAPHISNTHFCLWRTVDGGASWQALDLSGLEAELPADRPGIHTCSLWLDPETAGGVQVRCSLHDNSSMEDAFVIRTADYGETWRVDDRDPQIEALLSATEAMNREEGDNP